MKRKRILALILVLAMAAALIGCGSAVKGADYQFILNACSDWLEDPDDLSALSTFMGGSFIGDEFHELMQALVDSSMVAPEDLISGVEDDLDVPVGSAVEFTVTGETDADAKQAAAYQTDLDSTTEGLRTTAELFFSMRDMLQGSIADMSEEERAQIDAEFRDENGMSVDEYLAIMERLGNSYSAIAEKLDGAEVTGVVTAEVSYDTQDGTTTEEIVFLKIDSTWASVYMLDMLKELAKIA